MACKLLSLTYKVEGNLACSICFDFVERTKFHEKIIRHCCQKGNNVEAPSTLSKESFDL